MTKILYQGTSLVMSFVYNPDQTTVLAVEELEVSKTGEGVVLFDISRVVHCIFITCGQNVQTN